MVVRGHDGNDRLVLASGLNTVVEGGDGNDYIDMSGLVFSSAHFPNNSLFGGAGDDILCPNSNNAYLSGGSGNDEYRFPRLSDNPIYAGTHEISESSGGEIDTLNFDGALSDIKVDLTSNTVATYGYQTVVANGSQARHFENVRTGDGDLKQETWVPMAPNPEASAALSTSGG